MGDYHLGHKKQPGGNTLKYGGKGGEYDNHAHKGSGRQQNLYPPAAGEDYNKPTPHHRDGSQVPARDGTHGHGSAKRGYQTDAHSEAHHHHGEAVGKKEDNKPFNWESPLHAEGKKNFIGKDSGHTFLEAKSGPNSNKAEHHPRMSDEPHRFSRPPLKDAHGYGHSATNRMGHLRLSGHDGGHMVGTKPTKKSPSYPKRGHNLIDR